ncbi:MAG: capsid jelly roll protein [Cressdnaviricota sp.]|nr:MAG: capsid jelly roll protein [Cressdnaviricota sp.]
MNRYKMAYRRRYRRKAPSNPRRWRKARRAAARMRLRRGRAGGSGSLMVVRKTALINLANAPGIAGLWNLNDPTGTCVQLGAPVFIPGTSNCYDTPFSLKFQLNQLMNSTDIVNISDRYRILKAKVRIHANFNQTGTVNVGTTPWIEHYVDHDDATVPAISQVRERMGVKTKYFSGSKPAITMLCRPRFADTIYRSGVASAYGVGNRREYINTAYADVEHYGIKGILHNVPLTGAGSGGSLFDVDVQLYVIAKDLQ